MEVNLIMTKKLFFFRCETYYDLVEEKVYRDECGVEYDTTCHQELSDTFTIKGYEPQKMKRDLKETLVPVTQGKVVVTFNSVSTHNIVYRIGTICPRTFAYFNVFKFNIKMGKASLTYRI